MRAHIIGQQICTQLTIPRYIFILVTEGTSWLDKSIANRDQEYLDVDRFIVLCDLRYMRTHIIGQQISSQLTPSRYIFVLITEGTSLLEKASANRDQEYLDVDKLIVLGDLRCAKSGLRTIKIRPRADRFISFRDLRYTRTHIIGQQI